MKPSFALSHSVHYYNPLAHPNWLKLLRQISSKLFGNRLGDRYTGFALEKSQDVLL
jgi:hypothetical protein